jgi:hypothetical protein
LSDECLVGRATGEISAPGQTTVNLALCVPLEQARAAVEIVDEAKTLTDAQVADRAEQVLRIYDNAIPRDRRVRLWQVDALGDGATPEGR